MKIALLVSQRYKARPTNNQMFIFRMHLMYLLPILTFEIKIFIIYQYPSTGANKMDGAGIHPAQDLHPPEWRLELWLVTVLCLKYLPLLFSDKVKKNLVLT